MEKAVAKEAYRILQATEILKGHEGVSDKCNYTLKFIKDPICQVEIYINGHTHGFVELSVDQLSQIIHINKERALAKLRTLEEELKSL